MALTAAASHPPHPHPFLELRTCHSCASSVRLEFSFQPRKAPRGMIIISTFLYTDGDSDPGPGGDFATKRKGLLLMRLTTRRPADLPAI